MDKITKLLEQGIYEGDPISFLSQQAGEEPKELLEKAFIALNKQITGMAPLVIATILSKTPDGVLFLLKNDLYRFCQYLLPDDILIIADILKNKELGKGLGSFAQKLLRSTMENWTVQDLEEFDNGQIIKELAKIVHPRFKGKKGEILRKFLGN